MTVPPPNYPPPPPATPPGGQAGDPPPDNARRERRFGNLVGIIFVLATIAIGLGNGLEIIVALFIGAVVLGTVGIAVRTTRPFAAGFLTAVALTAIVVAGACLGLIVLVTGTYGR